METAARSLTYTAPNCAPSQDSDYGNIMGVMLSRSRPATTTTTRSLAQVVHPAGAAGRPAAGAGFPMARFTMLADSPGEEQDVIFDAASSIAACVPDPAESEQRHEVHAGSTARSRPTSGTSATARPAAARASPPASRTAARSTSSLMVTNDRGFSNSVSQTVTVAGRRQPDGGLRDVAGGAGRQPAGVLRRQRVEGRTWPDDQPLRLELRRRRLRQRRHRVAPLLAGRATSRSR